MNPRTDGSITAGWLARRPSALIPLAMSFAALLLVLGAAATGNARPEPDEGAGAHVWQLLMAGQLPFAGYFALNWLPRAPRAALQVLALWAFAFAAAMLPVYLLKL